MRTRATTTTTASSSRPRRRDLTATRSPTLLALQVRLMTLARRNPARRLPAMSFRLCSPATSLRPCSPAANDEFPPLRCGSRLQRTPVSDSASGPPALSHALPPGGRSRVAGGCRSLGSGAGRRPVVGPLRWRLGGRHFLPLRGPAPLPPVARGSGGRRRCSPRGRQRSRVCCPADAPSSSNIADTNKRNKRGPISALEKAWALEDRKHLDALISRAISRVIN